jgi:hypothetical protein
MPRRNHRPRKRKPTVAETTATANTHPACQSCGRVTTPRPHTLCDFCTHQLWVQQRIEQLKAS